MFFSQQVFNEIATSEYFFDSNSIWKIYLGLSTPNEMFKWQKKRSFSLKWQTGQSPKCLVFSNFFILLRLSLCIAFPHLHWNSSSKALLLWTCQLSQKQELEKGMLGHPVSLAAGVVRRGQRTGVVLSPLIYFQVATGTFSVKPSSHLCFLLSTNGLGPHNHGVSNITLWKSFGFLLLNLRSLKETKCWW